jgi:hypothetical protein
MYHNIGVKNQKASITNMLQLAWNLENGMIIGGKFYGF